MKKLLILPVALLFGCATGGYDEDYPIHEPKLLGPNPAQAARYPSDFAECQRLAFASIESAPRETWDSAGGEETNQNAARAAATGLAMGGLIGGDLKSMATGAVAGAALSVFLDAANAGQAMGYGGMLGSLDLVPGRIDQCLRNRGYRLVEPGAN
jgi:hypothetical protein